MAPLTFFLCATLSATSIMSVGAMKDIEEVTEKDSKIAARDDSSSREGQERTLGSAGTDSAQFFSDANSAEFYNGLVGIFTRMREDKNDVNIREWKKEIMKLDTEGTLKGYLVISKYIVDVYFTLKYLSLLVRTNTALLEDRVRLSLIEHFSRSVYQKKYAMTQQLALPLAKLINSGKPSEVISVESLAKDVVTVLTRNNAIYEEIRSAYPDTKRIFRTNA